jgi:hypothetical protein
MRFLKVQMTSLYNFYVLRTCRVNSTVNHERSIQTQRHEQRETVSTANMTLSAKCVADQHNGSRHSRWVTVTNQKQEDCSDTAEVIRKNSDVLRTTVWGTVLSGLSRTLCGHEGGFLQLKTWYVSLPSCFIRLNSCVVFWPPATQWKQRGAIRMAHPAPRTSGSLSLNEPEVMVTLVRVSSRSRELRNEHDHLCYYVVVCGSKKLVWRPSTVAIYCNRPRTARCNIKQFYVLPTQCIYVFCVDLRTNSNYFPMQH